MRHHNVWVLVATVSAACVQTFDEPATQPPEADVVLERSLMGAWDESRAPAAEPCGGASLARCAEETHGACEQVPLPTGDACVPVFQWGVTRDGVVELGSTKRLFTIPDLARAPLDADELAEGRLRAELIAATRPVEASSEPSLIAVNHSGVCSPWTFCDRVYTNRFVSHWNADGRHHHGYIAYDNTSSPWYYCNARGNYRFQYSRACGTP